jgi:hypothetical protein
MGKTKGLVIFMTTIGLVFVMAMAAAAQTSQPHPVEPPPNSTPCVPHLLPVPTTGLDPYEEFQHEQRKSLAEVGICTCLNCHNKFSDQAEKGIKESLKKNPKAMANYKHPPIANPNSENLTVRYKRAQAQFAKLDRAQQLEIQKQINALGRPQDRKNLEALLDKLGSGFFKPKGRLK